MSQLVNVEPSSYKEAASQHVWVDAMIEEYSSIMKKDVWEVVPRPTGESVVTIAPVARYTTFRTIISLVALFGWKLHQIDVKTVYLNSKIEQEAHIEQPEGFVTHGKKTHVCKLKKALYVWTEISSESLVCEDGWISP